MFGMDPARRADAWGDELGPECIQLVYDPETGARGVTVVDNSTLGPPGGGTRMSPELTIREVADLARAMTYKWGIFGIPRGGSKTGVYGDPAMPAADKARVLRGFGRRLREHMVSREAHLGPDMGLTVDDVARIYEGARLDYPRSGLFARPYEDDPAGFAMTGYGVVRAIRTASARLGHALAGSTVAIQGFGQVGVGCARFAFREGARVVALSTRDGAVYDPDGLDVEQLLALRRVHGDRCVHEYRGGASIDAEALLLLEVDMLILAAGPAAIDARNDRALRAKLVASGGNNAVADPSLDTLHGRGIFVIPDFVASGGGIIGSQVDFLKGTLDQAFGAMDHLIGGVTDRLTDESLRTGVEPAAVGRRWVRDRIFASRELPRKTFAQAMAETRDLLGVF